jgi:MOSC domain-containing protein YiiM
VAVGSVGEPRAARLKQINISPGGVPKTPVPQARIGYTGLEGDRQRDRKHHGRPFQAVCLWSEEIIEGLAASGHPIAAGNAGENLTLSGLDWLELRPGTRVRVGDALLEISFPSTPCHNQTQWFTDGDFTRIGFERDPAATRWYAWVREPGEVVVGDLVSFPV